MVLMQGDRETGCPHYEVGEATLPEHLDETPVTDRGGCAFGPSEAKPQARTYPPKRSCQTSESTSNMPVNRDEFTTLQKDSQFLSETPKRPKSHEF